MISCVTRHDGVEEDEANGVTIYEVAGEVFVRPRLGSYSPQVFL